MNIRQTFLVAVWNNDPNNLQTSIPLDGAYGIGINSCTNSVFVGSNKEVAASTLTELDSAGTVIGQYLQPSAKHHPLSRYYHPSEFKELESIAKTKGFLLVSSSPLTRSSYHADEDFRKLQDARNKKLECHPQK